jgi:gamma-glutamylcyclotransferase (GGCT)/AIG2-like uncharacterized protein YtfP
MLIFSFGSNLFRAQMHERCPRSNYVTSATLPGYRLAFRGHSLRWRGTVATILPAKGEVVRGTLWWVSQEDLSRLDGFEGHPRYYVRESLTVRAGDKGKHAHADAYVLRSGSFAAPSAHYYETILKGYKTEKFARRLLDDAVAFSMAKGEKERASEARKWKKIFGEMKAARKEIRGYGGGAKGDPFASPCGLCGCDVGPDDPLAGESICAGCTGWPREGMLDASH